MTEYFTVENEEGDRIDRYLAEEMPERSRSYLQKLIKEQYIKVNNKPVKANYRLVLGDRVEVCIPEAKEPDIEPENIPLDILYEDEDLIFVDKPAGIVSHPSKGHLSDSMINGVQAYFENEGREKNERSNIHLIGRLDKETSGILGIAKNSVTAERMIKQRQRGILIKEYYALVKGNPPEEGILEIPMEEMRDARDGDKLKMKVGKSENAKTAKTFFQVVKRFEKFSLVSLVIETGRTHQIRFHMASIGCPLLGDSFYGDGPELGISRTALHAQQLTFTHPFCEKVMRIESEMPKDLSFLLR